MAAGQSVWLLCQVDHSVIMFRLGLANLVLQVVTCGQLVGLNNSLILGYKYGYICSLVINHMSLPARPNLPVHI